MWKEIALPTVVFVLLVFFPFPLHDESVVS